MAFKIEDNEMNPIFVFAKLCWSVHTKQTCIANRKPTPTQHLQFHVKLMCMPY